MTDRSKFDDQTLVVEQFRNSWMGWFLPKKVRGALDTILAAGHHLYEASINQDKNLTAARGEATTLRTSLIELETELAQLRKSHTDLETELTQTQETLAERAGELKKVREENETTKEALATEAETVQAQAVELVRVGDSLTATQDLLTQTQNECDAANRRVKDALARVRQLEARPTISTVETRDYYRVFDLKVNGKVVQIIATAAAMNRLVDDSEKRRDKI